MTNKTHRLCIVCCLGFISLIGCGKSGLAGLSDEELRDKNYECVQRNPTSPGKVTSCENIKRECLKRREKGIYAC